MDYSRYSHVEIVFCNHDDEKIINTISNIKNIDKDKDLYYLDEKWNSRNQISWYLKCKDVDYGSHHQRVTDEQDLNLLMMINEIGITIL